MLSGKQRLRQICVKNQIISRREMQAFMAGKLPWLPCSGDRERDFICAEFDRVYAMGVAAGRAALTLEQGERGRHA